MLIFERETWNEIYYSLSKNKLRTILTMIGVAWGMFLYIFLLGAAKGAENGFNRIFTGLSTNSIFILSDITGESYKGFTRGRKIDLHTDDIQILMENIPHIDLIAPRNMQASNVIRRNISKSYTIFGDYPIINVIQKKILIKGRFLNDNDIKNKGKVAVIGEEIAEQLFKKNENPIGEYIKIGGIYFQIIGVYKEPIGALFEENNIFIPFNTFQSMYNLGNKIGWMTITINPNYDVKQIEKNIKSVLKEKHDVSPTDEKAFIAINLAEFFDKTTNFLNGLQIITWIVGGLTILAGVIAISNILLITVKERTLEIGIRRALGAKPIEIKQQILLESVFLTLFSGTIGFIMGTLSLIFLNNTFGGKIDLPFYNPTVNIVNILISLSLMVGLGLFIGLIPAQRATQIKPIEALRSE